MAAQVSHNLGIDVLQGSGQQLGDFSYSQLAQHFQSSIAQMAERQAHTVVQASSMERYLQQAACSSDASIGDASENVGAAGRQSREVEQASDGSKRSADDECNVDPAAPAEGVADPAAVAPNGKRLKVQHSRALTEDEKAQRRREGNRKAAQRLRQRRMETVAKLEEEVAKLEQERLVYLNHMYQLAASARSVVEENRALRARLKLIAASPATSLAKPPLPVPAKHTAPPPPPQAPAPILPSMGSVNSAVNSACMDFEAVRRELFSSSGAAVWPGPVRPSSHPGSVNGGTDGTRLEVLLHGRH